MAQRRPIPEDENGHSSGSRSWLHGLHFSWFSLVTLGILLLAVVVLAPTVHTLVEERAQIADLQKNVEAQRSHVEQMKKDLARWDDPSYIRAQARSRLLYVMPGDTSYLVIDDRDRRPEADTDQAVTDDLQPTRTDWLASMLDSYLTAGVTDRPASRLSLEGDPSR